MPPRPLPPAKKRQCHAQNCTRAASTHPLLAGEDELALGALRVPAVVGLARDGDGGVRVGNRVIAKLSRTEVAEKFLLPAPEPLLRGLVEQSLITAEQAELARLVPMADALTAEADSGGHTDGRPLSVLLPEIIALRDRIGREAALGHRVHVAPRAVSAPPRPPAPPSPWAPTTSSRVR